ncbi:hypothetical protein [Methanobrevibacter intestini]|uniref:hypothetical protein n=1 Tax=Methanobrevibacter intestini TaxID=2911853 RepID=UPI003D02C046
MKRLIDKILQEMNSTPEPMSMTLTELNILKQYERSCLLRMKMKMMGIPDYEEIK